eukprot:gene2427-5367_t
MPVQLSNDSDGIRVTASSEEQEDANEAKPDTDFNCNICLDKVSEPVVTRCGHLFCWPCLHEWLQLKPDCPVCKAGVTPESVISLYTSGNTNNPRDNNHPPRPQAQRSPPVPQPHFHAQFFFGIPPFGFNIRAGENPEMQQQNQPYTWLIIGLLLILLLEFI